MVSDRLVVICSHESFPEVPEEVFRSFITMVDTDVYYSGQNIATQGLLEDRFFVVRRGKADIIVDGIKVGVLRAGESFGEMGLFYGGKSTRDLPLVVMDGPTLRYRL